MLRKKKTAIVDDTGGRFTFLFDNNVFICGIIYYFLSVLGKFGLFVSFVQQRGEEVCDSSCWLLVGSGIRLFFFRVLYVIKKSVFIGIILEGKFRV